MVRGKLVGEKEEIGKRRIGRGKEEIGKRKVGRRKRGD